MTPLDIELRQSDVNTCARRLLGAVIERRVGRKVIKARIVETEGYDQDDPASHSFRRTGRSEIMFGSAGLAYIYFIYGMYHCLNVVCGPAGFGSAVLIRAAEPLNEFDHLLSKRKVKRKEDILSGPGKLCQALNITGKFNRHDLSRSPLKLILRKHVPQDNIVSGPRIGIKKAADLHRRFYLKGNPYISHP